MKVIKSWRKSITLKVKNGELIVRAPIFMMNYQINNFVNKNKDWIEKQIKQDLEKKKYSDSEILELKNRAKDYIPKRVEKIALDNGFKYNNIRITSAKTRWGSCTSKKNLNFSFYLIGAPKEVIDYVIVHELSHLKEMNHSRKFRNIVESIMPDYKNHEKWLKINGNTILL